MPDAPAPPAAPTRWQKWVVAVLGAVVVVHSALIMLWLAPTSPIRHAVGDTRLATYVDPYFQQSADTVGLSAQYVDESFRVRAYVTPESGGKPKITPWVDLTRTEDGATRHEIGPARVHLIARRLATNLNLAMFGLAPAQRQIISTITAKQPPSEFGGELAGAGDDAAALQTYLSYDQMATQFASLYAHARWKGTVYQVQYSVGRRTVPPYSERSAKTLKDVKYLYFGFGWRIAFRGSAEAQASFDSYVKKM